MANIGFMKMGKVLHFEPLRFSAAGGDEEPWAFLRLAANAYPEHNFHVLTKDAPRERESALTRYFPYGNVHFTWPLDEPDPMAWYRLPEKAIEYMDHALDAFIWYTGPNGQVNIPNFLYTVRGERRYAKVLAMCQRYSAPVVWTLNCHPHIPQVAICPDERGAIRARDLCNVPPYVMAQFDFDWKFKHITKLGPTVDDRSASEIKGKCDYYATGIERIIQAWDEVRPFNENREFPLGVILNQVDPVERSAFNRLNIFEDYVVKGLGEEVPVWGTWSEDAHALYPQLKGAIPWSQYDRFWDKIKVTFLCSTMLGRVTPKLYSCWKSGTVTFVHKNYDTLCQAIPLRHFLRVTDPDDLRTKANAVLKDKDLYLTLVQQQWNWLGDPYKEALKVMNHIMALALKQIGFPELLSKIRNERSVKNGGGQDSQLSLPAVAGQGTA